MPRLSPDHIRVSEPYLSSVHIRASEGQFPHYAAAVLMTVAYVYLQDRDKNKIM